MNTVKSLPRQSLFDIALMTSGSAEAALTLARLNDMSVTDMPESGRIITLSGEVLRPGVVNWYDVNRITPATDLSAATLISGIGGISYWAVNVDFVVS